MSQRDDFRQPLVPRTEALKLGRPLYYALIFCTELLDTPVPAGVLRAAEAHAPGRVSRGLMGRLVPRVLEPRYPTRRPARVAAWILYMRSH